MTHVIVASKMPNDLILRLFKMGEENVPTPLGFTKMNIGREIGQRVRINGSAIPFGVMPEYPLTNGYALTKVEADFWDAWCEQNKDSDLLASGVLFAADSQQEAQAQALDQRKDGVKSGMEQVDPNNLPKGLSMRKEIKISTDDDMNKSLFRPIIDDTMPSAKNRSTSHGRVRRGAEA
jgi:hypothetical protein